MLDTSSTAYKSLAALDMQNSELVADLLRRQGVLESKRSPWEQAYRDVDRRVDPSMAGGFGNGTSPGRIRGLENFDTTAPRHLSRATAALASVTVPRNQIYEGMVTLDKELNKLDSVKRWCEHANDRRFAARYNPLAGFESQIYGDLRQSLSYGTAPFWTHEKPGFHLIYNAIHLAEVWIDQDACGRVDTVHRKHKMTARQAMQEFGEESLPERVRGQCRDMGGARADEQSEYLQVIRPHADYVSGAFGRSGMRVESIHFSVDDKWICRHGGFRTHPLSVSRHIISPGDIYGRSPAMEVMGTIKTVNEAARTILKQAQLAVSPAWALGSDLDLSVLVTKPNGLNPGLLDDRGEFKAKPLPMGGQYQLAFEVLTQMREEIRSAYIEDFFKILSDPSDRMTATQVIETMQKQGVLIAPFAGRYETEKMAPIAERELDILIRAGQIDPMPPEMIEAGAKLRVVMENPLARMARAEEAGGFARWLEMAVQLAPFDQGVIDVVNTDAAMRGVGEVLGVRPSWINSPDEVAAKRAQREYAAQQQAAIQAVPAAAGAALDLAKAGQLAEAA